MASERTLSRLGIATVLATTALTATAGAATWHSFSVSNLKAKIEGGGSGTHTARLTSMVLPDSFKVKKSGTKLTFGQVGACKSTGTIAPVLVHSTKTSAADVLEDELGPGGTDYGSGTNGDAVYSVRKYSGDKLRAAYVRRANIADTWIIVRTRTTPHASCHTGGVRESLGFPLADAYGTARASGF